MTTPSQQVHRMAAPTSLRYLLIASVLAAACSAAFLGCATTAPAQTIEPPGGHSSGGAASGSTDSFVISREPAAEEKPPSEDSLHIGDKWWRFRGGFLKMPEAQVRERDMAVSMKQAPHPWQRLAR